MDSKRLFDEILSQRDEVLNDIFGDENLSDLDENDKDELFAMVIEELLFRYGTSEYFENPEEFLNNFLSEKGFERDEDWDEDYDEEDEDF